MTTFKRKDRASRETTRYRPRKRSSASTSVSAAALKRCARAAFRCFTASSARVMFAFIVCCRAVMSARSPRPWRACSRRRLSSDVLIATTRAVS